MHDRTGAVLARLGAPAAVAGGALWLVVWFHSVYAHGLGEVNRREVVLALTWMDAGKLLVACFLLILVAALALYARPLGAAVLAAGLARGRALAWPAALVLGVTGPSSFFLTPVYPALGAAWLLVGLATLRGRGAIP